VRVVVVDAEKKKRLPGDTAFARYPSVVLTALCIQSFPFAALVSRVWETQWGKKTKQSRPKTTTMQIVEAFGRIRENGSAF
jgi:hypothetical protein